MTADKGDPPRSRRYPIVAIALLVVAAAFFWVASRLNWVHLTSADGLGEQRNTDLDGTAWVSVLTPFALVLVAAIAALFATKGWLRRLVGILVALVGAMAAVPALALMTGGISADRAKRVADLPDRAKIVEAHAQVLPAIVTLFGGLAAFGAGLLLARKPPADAGLSTKYANPATRRADATRRVADSKRTGRDDAPSERTLWDALDAGEDPTTGSSGESDTRP